MVKIEDFSFFGISAPKAKKMFFTYILESTSKGHFYIGQTSDMESRLQRHNAGKNRSTKFGVPWRILYWKEFESRREAIRMEMLLKRLKKRAAIVDFAVKNSFRGVAQSG